MDPRGHLARCVTADRSEHERGAEIGRADAAYRPWPELSAATVTARIDDQTSMVVSREMREGETMTITPDEQARRRRSVDRARHSTEMEGGQSSPGARDVQEAHVRGDLTLDEYLRRATDPQSRD